MKLFKKFVTYYKPYKFVFFMDLFCALIVSLIDLAFPQILNFLSDTFYLESSSEIISGLLKLGVGLFCLYLIRSICSYYITYKGHVMGAYMESTMRQELFEQYERFSFSYYDTHNTGKMMSKLISDLFDITELAHHGPENIFISFIKIVGSVILLLEINVPLTLILGVIIIIMIITSFYQNAVVSNAFTDNRVKIAGINSRLQDSLSGIRVVKSFANEDIEDRKFIEGNDAFLVSQEKKYRRMADFFTGNNFFEGMLYVVVLTAGGYFIAKGSITPTDLAVYALYINILINPIDVLVELTELMQKGISGFRRFVEVLDTVPEILDAKDAKELTNVKGTIDYNDVSFRYNDEESVLDHISFHVDAGQKIALVGPSGGGKSTLCALLPRFYDVTQGEVLIDGQDVRTLSQKSLRRAIGMVQQDVYLFDGTIRENILYGRIGASDEDMISAAKAADIHNFIVSLPDGYDTYVGERGTRLSGGQKQRISIARVFLKNPPILILDEATSALDNESEEHIQESLDRLASGRTTITIAHRLSTIKNADEIIVIDADGIKERGTHEKLIAQNGIYSRYYNMQFAHQEMNV